MPHPLPGLLRRQGNRLHDIDCRYLLWNSTPFNVEEWQTLRKQINISSTKYQLTD